MSIDEISYGNNLTINVFESFCFLNSLNRFRISLLVFDYHSLSEVKALNFTQYLQPHPIDF